MVGEIVLRKATVHDSKMLLEWRNDEETRRNSLNQNVITPEEHASWFDKISHSSDHIFLIAESDGTPVGAFRLDKISVPEEILANPDLRQISYVVAPGQRRRGYGMAIVKEGCLSYGQEYGLLAQTRRDNEASRKILHLCGFTLVGEVNNGILAYIRNSANADKQTVH